MTISTTASRVDYVGDDFSTAFAVPWPFFGPGELRVIRRTIATGAEAVLVLGTDYTVTGGNGATGTVTATTAPPSTVQWTILRNTNRTQEIDYQPNDPFPAETHERALDRIVAVVQEVERDQARAVRVAETDAGTVVLPSSVARAQKFLAFGVSGEPVAVTLDLGGNPVTPFAATLLGASDAAAARTTLGAAGLAANTFTGDQTISKASPLAVLNKNGSEQANRIEGRLNGTQQILIDLGGDTTGDFRIGRFNDGGTFQDFPLVIARATGNPTVSQPAAWRAAIGAPAIPTGTTGVPGHFIRLSIPENTTFNLPAGGTWAFAYTFFTNGVFTNGEAGLQPGGATIAITGTGVTCGGWAWRIA